MDEKIYLCVIIMYLIKTSVATLCTVRNDGHCYYTVNCAKPAKIKTIPPCGDIDPFISLIINKSPIRIVTAKFFNTKFDSYVRILSAVKNNWDVVQNSAFSNFENVQYMDLSDNHIKSIGKAFSGLEELDSLNMSRNHLEVINPGAFMCSENNSRLYLLDLSYNLLTYLSEDFFVNMNNLRRLYLQGNQLTTLEDLSFKNLKKLYYLNFCCNNLITHNLTMKQMPSLKELDVSYNHLENVDISELTSLETINLSHNDIEDIMFDDFEQFNHLEELDLSYNKLKNLTSSNSEQTAHKDKPLVKLHLNHNNISTIDESFFLVFNYINYLNLSNNEITEFKPGTFKHVKVLKVFIVPNCKTKITDDTIMDLKNTIIINLTRQYED